MAGMQLTLFPTLGPHQSDASVTGMDQAVSLSQAYTREDLIKAARRIGRRLQRQSFNELVVRVAIQDDSIARRLHEGEKTALTQMIRAEMDGDFPLPRSGTTYPSNRWEGLYLRIGDTPYCQAFERRCQTVLKRVANEIGEELINDILDNHWIYFAKMQIDASIGRYAFSNGGDPERWPHTPATLYAFFEDAERKLKDKGEALLEFLSDLAIYQRSTSPQSIVDRLADLDHSIAIRILKRVHNITFGHHRDPTGRITPEELWNGKTVADVIAADQKAQSDQEQHWEDFQRRRRKKLLELYVIMEEVGDYPATVTKALKDRNSDIRLRTAQSQYCRYASIDLGDGGLFWSQSPRLDETLDAVKHEAEQLFHPGAAK